MITAHQRRLALVSAGIVIGAALLAAPAYGQAGGKTPYAIINAAAAATSVPTTRLRGDLTVLEGSGGNITALTGSDGLLLVDAGIAVSRARIEARLHDIRPGPVTYLINTHWHWDHTDGNGWVHGDGATIIAQRNTARHLGQRIRVVEWGHTFAPVPAGYRPAMLVDQTRTLPFDGEQVRIRHYAPAHTDGDLSVYFPRADVLATGDTWWNGIYPFIDYAAGGSIGGMIAAANANIAMTTARTIIVPGHGPVGSRAELIAYRDMLVAIRGRVAALKRQGKSLAEIVRAKPTAAFDKRWGGGVIGPALFTELVYRGV